MRPIHIYNEIIFSLKKELILSFLVIWMITKDVKKHKPGTER